jgi:hypothetical protein
VYVPLVRSCEKDGEVLGFLVVGCGGFLEGGGEVFGGEVVAAEERGG